MWRLSWRADPRARAIADRHYNRQKIGATQFVPPGRCLVLLTEAADAFWITSWPFGEFVQHRWSGAWVCSAFRNEGKALSSELEGAGLLGPEVSGAARGPGALLGYPDGPRPEREGSGDAGGLGGGSPYPGEPVANPNSRRLTEKWFAAHPSRPEPHRRDDPVADPHGSGRHGTQGLPLRSGPFDAAPQPERRGEGGEAATAPWPPGPDDEEGWEAYLREWPGLEPAIRGGAHGLADRAHQLAVLGNGVVPEQGAAAIRILAERLGVKI